MEWENGDKVMVDGMEHVYIGPDYYTFGEPTRNLHVVMDTRTGEYASVHERSIRPAPRTIESIVQEAVEDYFCSQGFGDVPRGTIDAFMSLPHRQNALHAIIEAAILADRETR